MLTIWRYNLLDAADESKRPYIIPKHTFWLPLALREHVAGARIVNFILNGKSPTTQKRSIGILKHFVHQVATTINIRICYTFTHRVTRVKES